jgi:hypothetical protein
MQTGGDMQTKLPSFEKNPVLAADLRITGKLEDRVGALNVGEEVFMVVRGAVLGVGHLQTDEGIIRTHTVRATDLILISADEGLQMLAEAP